MSVRLATAVLLRNLSVLALLSSCSSSPVSPPSPPPPPAVPPSASLVITPSGVQTVAIPVLGHEPGGDPVVRTVVFDIAKPVGGTEVTGLSVGSFETSGGLPSLFEGTAQLSQATTPATLTLSIRWNPFGQWAGLIVPILIQGTRSFANLIYLAQGGVGASDLVLIEPPLTRLTSGSTANVSARVLGSSGEPLAGAPVSWSSSHPEIARIDQSGSLTAVAPGVTRIEATSGDRNGGYELTVASPATIPGRLIFTYHSYGSTDAILASNTDGGDVTTLFRAEGRTIGDLRRSPDGRWLAFASAALYPPNYVYVAPSNGGQPIPITTGSVVVRPQGWNGDGTQLLVVNLQGFGGAQRLELYARTGGKIADLTPAGLAVSGGSWVRGGIIANVYDPAKFPDQGYLAVIDTHGGAPVRITQDGTYQPTLSPDSTRLAYLRCISRVASCGTNEVVISDVDVVTRSVSQPLKSPPLVAHACWTWFGARTADCSWCGPSVTRTAAPPPGCSSCPPMAAVRSKSRQASAPRAQVWLRAVWRSLPMGST